jgi:hypothetical protein
MRAKIHLLEGLSKSVPSLKIVLKKGKPFDTEDPKVIAHFKTEKDVRVEILPEKGRPPKEVANAGKEDDEKKKKKKKKLVKKT